MVSFVLIYNNEDNFKYTIESIKKNNSEECEYIVVAKKGSILKDKYENIDIIEYEENQSIAISLNEAIQKSNYETCFVIKSGCYVTNQAIESLRLNLYDETVGIALPRLNSLCESQQHVFANVFEEQILQEAQFAKNNFYGKSIFSKDIDDNLIAFKTDTFIKIGGFDEKFNILPIIYKSYLYKNFQNKYNVKVYLDALVCTRDLYDDRILKSSQSDCLSKEIGLDVKKYDEYKTEIINYMDRNTYENINVLEVGCNAGYTLMEVKNKYPYSNVYGIANVANYQYIAPPCIQLMVGEYMSALNSVPDNSFDYILLQCVLEQLYDPWEFVRMCKRKLKANGKIISVVKNIGHISVIQEFLNGFFIYKNEGPLQANNIRFFTLDSASRLFSENGFNTENIIAQKNEDPYEDYLISQLANVTLIDRSIQHMAPIDQQYGITEYILICSKAGE